MELMKNKKENKIRKQVNMAESMTNPEKVTKNKQHEWMTEIIR